MAEEIIAVESAAIISEIFGSFDSNIALIEDQFGVRISNRSGDGNSITVSGDEENIAPAVKTLKYLHKTALAGESVTEQVTMYAIGMCRDGLDSELSALDDSVVCITAKGKPIKSKTVGQKKYVELIRKNTIVLGNGKDLPRSGYGGLRASEERGLKNNPHTTGGRSRRTARIPSRRPAEQDRPLSATAL